MVKTAIAKASQQEKAAHDVERSPDPTLQQTSSSNHHPLLTLQRSVGNRAVGQLIQSSVGNGTLQRKCAACEQTAIANETCPACEQEQETLQRLATSQSDSTESTEVPPIVHDVLRSPGHSLDSDTREFMESRLNQDFSQVRVHTDTKAAESAQAVNAQAYTVGQNVVLGAGQYTPATLTGKTLLAHELAHVVQQKHAASTLHPHRINSPGGADEREADIIAAQVVAGEQVPQLYPSTSLTLQRKMLNSVVSNFQPQAKACVIHLHGEERTALAVAKEVRSRRCVNLVHLDTNDRYIDFEVDVGGKTHACEADPNRVFSDAGRRKNALADKGCHLAADKAKKRTDPNKDVNDAAAAELEKFVKNEWGKKISECQGGSGSSVEDGTLPVLALHNNEKGKTPLIQQYAGAAEKGDRLPADPKDPKKKLPNPAIQPGEEINDFFFVTQLKDFMALRGNHNVLLQANPVPPSQEDGSLSVALQNKRFINVEKRGRNHEKLVKKGGKFQAPDPTYAQNYAMAAEALDLFGVPDGPCSPAQTTSQPTTTEPARSATTLPTDKPLLAKDPAPITACVLFDNQAALDKRRDEWTQKLGKMPLRTIINWILGSPVAPPQEAKREVEIQRKCMVAEMATSLATQKLSLPTGDIIQSERRSFKYQRNRIWLKKFQFQFGDKFGHISDVARKKCDPLLGSDKEWNPASDDHKKCWGTDKISGILTSEEKEKEILMTSAAPGISRHHAGTDFDFGQSDKDLTPEVWTGSGKFADAYRWLAPNAARFGFIQPFDTKGKYGEGYTPERWHWSYYPIAQALLNFAKLHQTEIEEELRRHWADTTGKAPRPEFKFIWDNWKKFMFNVEEKGIF